MIGRYVVCASSVMEVGNVVNLSLAFPGSRNLAKYCAERISDSTVTSIILDPRCRWSMVNHVRSGGYSHSLVLCHTDLLKRFLG